jgi:hypothetical protein
MGRISCDYLITTQKDFLARLRGLFYCVWGFSLRRHGTCLCSPVLLYIFWDLLHLVAAKTIGVTRLPICAIIRVAALTAANEKKEM